MDSLELIKDFLWSQLQYNQFLTGATLTGLIASIFYLLRGWLMSAYYRVKRFFKVSITIHSEDSLYVPVSTWLYNNGFDKFSKAYRIRYLNGKPTYGPTEGSFFFIYKRSLVYISIAKDAQVTASSWGTQTREYLTVSYYSFGRSRDLLNTIISAAMEEYNNRLPGVPVYTMRGGNSHLITKIPKRETPSIVLADDRLQQVEADLSKFKESKQWYLDRGIPYHRGYLLTGPPGTGKTSLVRHLAQRFDTPVYVSDGSLSSIQSVPENSILLLEDIDSISKTRVKKKQEEIPMPPAQPDIPEKEEYTIITVSELLNALDGVTSVTGVVVIMTTNYPEKIDPAVIRPGRVDYKLHLDYCTDEQAARIFGKFYGVLPTNLVLKKAFTPAQLQEIFITNSAELAQALITT